MRRDSGDVPLLTAAEEHARLEYAEADEENHAQGAQDDKEEADRHGGRGNTYHEMSSCASCASIKMINELVKNERSTSGSCFMNLFTAFFQCLCFVLSFQPLIPTLQKQCFTNKQEVKLN